MSCGTTPYFDPAKAKQEILKLEAAQRTYHLTKNARLFTDLFSDHFLSINKGFVDSPARSQSFGKFDTYFKESNIVKWDDRVEPVIRFSDDGSIAYVAVQKQVILKIPGANGTFRNDTTDFAWLTIYKKTGNDWRIDCVVSTNK